MKTKEPDDQFTPEETARRRDAIIKRMIATPPTPHSTLKAKGKRKATPKSPKSRRSPK